MSYSKQPFLISVNYVTYHIATQNSTYLCLTALSYDKYNY